MEAQRIPLQDRPLCRRSDGACGGLGEVLGELDVLPLAREDQRKFLVGQLEDAEVQLSAPSMN